jgi:hypothetical protein
MVSTETPYKRIDDWNALIKKINEECENPPEGQSCEPLEPLEEAPPNHIWTRQDIEKVRDKLKELCKDVTFDAELDKWIKKIHDELEEALEQAWCDCECMDPCDNASKEPETIFIGTITTSGCGDISGEDCPDPAGVAELERTIVRLIDALDRYGASWPGYCELKEKVEELEEELEELNTELDALIDIKNRVCAEQLDESDAAACDSATTAVDNKQQEIDDKEAEIEETKTRRDEEQTKADQASTEADELAALTFIQSNSANLPSGDQPLANYVPNYNKPPSNIACDELPPANSCFPRDPSRCAVSWQLWARGVESWRGDCRQVSPPCPYTGWFAPILCIVWRQSGAGAAVWEPLPPIDMTGDTDWWSMKLAGGFTPSGRMYITTADECAVYSETALASSDCGDEWVECIIGDTYQVYEYEIRFYYSSVTEKVNCDGEPCAEEA